MCVALGYAQRLTALLKEVAVTEPEAAEHLRQLVETYNYDAIISLLSDTEKGATQ